MGKCLRWGELVRGDGAGSPLRASEHWINRLKGAKNAVGMGRGRRNAGSTLRRAPQRRGSTVWRIEMLCA